MTTNSTIIGTRTEVAGVLVVTISSPFPDLDGCQMRIDMVPGTARWASYETSFCGWRVDSYRDDCLARQSSIAKYVRPGRTVSLYCRCRSYFGSGSGSVRLTLFRGATRGPAKPSKDNGFLAWYSCEVTLPVGAMARVEESYYPGSDRDTLYVAHLEQWRMQRRAYLVRLFHDRRVIREAATLRAERREAIEARLRAAIERQRRLEMEAQVTASGRSGGRARRRAFQLRSAAVDQRRLAAALASTWYVEVQKCCNQAHSVDVGLDSRAIRWEAKYSFRHDPPRLPPGYEIAAVWMLESIQ